MVKNTISPLVRAEVQWCGKRVYCCHGNSEVFQLVCDKQLSVSCNLSNGFEMFFCSVLNLSFSYGKNNIASESSIRKMLCSMGHWSLVSGARSRYTQIDWFCCLVAVISAGAPSLQHCLMLVAEKLQTFSTVSECISITWFAPCRCFQFGSLSRARSRICTSVLLLPGCCSQNTSDSRANVVTGVYKSMPPGPVCNHVSGEHYSAHVVAFMHDALHDKLIESGIIL